MKGGAMDLSAIRALNLRLSPAAYLNPCPLTRPHLLSDLTNPKKKQIPSRKPHSILRSSSIPNSFFSGTLEGGRSDYHYNDIAGAVSDVPNDKVLQVVLVSPQIPGNTGCIARTCAASGVGLHLVEPLGYKVDDTKLKRAGLDYWPYPTTEAVQNNIHASWADFQDYFRQQNGEKRLLAFTKQGTSIHSDFSYKRGDWLVFGSETCGLPQQALLDCNREGMGGGTIRIPMIDTYVRCLNLSVSVGIALYEASRQLNYQQIQCSTESGLDSKSLFISEDIFG